MPKEEGHWESEGQFPQKIQIPVRQSSIKESEEHGPMQGKEVGNDEDEQRPHQPIFRTADCLCVPVITLGLVDCISVAHLFLLSLVRGVIVKPIRAPMLPLRDIQSVYRPRERIGAIPKEICKSHSIPTAARIKKMNPRRTWIPSHIRSWGGEGSWK